jgi:hypothetical protein
MILKRLSSRPEQGLRSCYRRSPLVRQPALVVGRSLPGMTTAGVFRSMRWMPPVELTAGALRGVGAWA